MEKEHPVPCFVLDPSVKHLVASLKSEFMISESWFWISELFAEYFVGSSKSRMVWGVSRSHGGV